MNSLNSSLKKLFSQCCMSLWIKQNNRCPLCQQEWTVQKLGKWFTLWFSPHAHWRSTSFKKIFTHTRWLTSDAHCPPTIDTPWQCSIFTFRAMEVNSFELKFPSSTPAPLKGMEARVGQGRDCKYCQGSASYTCPRCDSFSWYFNPPVKLQS